MNTLAAPIRESHTEPLARIEDHRNVTDGVLDLEQADPRRPVYAVPNGTGGWVDVSIAEFLGEVRRVAKGLIGSGLRPGDRAAVMSATSYQWAVIDQAMWFAGGVPVPIYETSSAHQIAQILAGSQAERVFIGDESLRRPVQAGANMVGGKHAELDIALISTSADLERIAARGSGVTDADVEAARSSAAADDLATLVYTSGTTGKPKGVRITHRNLAEGAANIVPFAAEILGGERSRTLLFLPLAHVLARAVQLVCLHRGIQVAHTSDPASLLEDLATFRPTWLLAVPRVLEKVYHSAAAKAEAEGRGRIFEIARATAVDYSKAVQAHTEHREAGPSALLRTRRRAFDALVYSKLKAKLGGQLTHIVSGASALNPEIAHFFTGMGLPVQEGYGLTESTAPITLNIPGATRVGSVGLPVPGNTVKLAEDGEILLKGPVIFSGYHGDEEATAEAFDEQGFFRSGDLGALDADGFLTITGRKKELIVTAGGKNVYPAPLEEGIRVHPLIAQAVVVGEDRPYVAALVGVDHERVLAWAERRGFEALHLRQVLENPDVRAALRTEIQTAIDRSNEQVSRAESIRAFDILPTDLTEESGYLTPSLKLMRSKVMEDFSEHIERLYHP